MLNAESLPQFLARIDKVALSVILDPRNEDSCREMRSLIVDYKILAAQEPAIAEDDIWHHKLLGLLNEILVALDGNQTKNTDQHLRLIVSYVRTMRGLIARLVAI